MSSNGPEGNNAAPATPKQQHLAPSGDPAAADPQQDGRHPQYPGSNAMQRLPPGARPWPSGSVEESQPPPQSLMSPPVGVPVHYSQQPPPPQQPQAYGPPSGAGPSGTAYWPPQHSPNSRYAGQVQFPGHHLPPAHLGMPGGHPYPLPPHPYPGQQQHLKPPGSEWPPKSNGGGLPQAQPYPQMESNASTSAHPGQPKLQSPRSGAANEENVDDSKQGFHSPPFPQTPTSHHRQMVQQQQQSQPTPTPSHLLPPTAHTGAEEAVDKLVAGVEDAARRMFFERLVLLNEKHGEVLSAAPQVSKTPVDLYHLYISCMQAGGFEQVTKDKAWKHLCPKANPSMQESSAAGYQLRRHYQKYLLSLECQETGQNAEALVAFADKMKKKKKEKEPPNTPAGASGSGKHNQHQQQQASTPQSSAGGMPPLLQCLKELRFKIYSPAIPPSTSLASTSSTPSNAAVHLPPPYDFAHQPMDSKRQYRSADPRKPATTTAYVPWPYNQSIWDYTKRPVAATEVTPSSSDFQYANPYKAAIANHLRSRSPRPDGFHTAQINYGAGSMQPPFYPGPQYRLPAYPSLHYLGERPRGYYPGTLSAAPNFYPFLAEESNYGETGHLKPVKQQAPPPNKSATAAKLRASLSSNAAAKAEKGQLTSAARYARWWNSPGEFPTNPYYYQQGPQHPAWAAAAQHAYPGHPAGYPGMRLPPGIRPPQMAELTEEQQRQHQQFYHHQQQQQAAYAAHMQQQQQAMAAAAAAAQHNQQMQQQQQQASSSSLQPPDTSRTSSSTTPIPPPASNATIAACGSRASSTGPPPQTSTPDSASRMSAGNNEEGTSQQQQIRPPSQQAPPSSSRHTPTPTYSSSYASNANAPTPPLTTSVPAMAGQAPATAVPPYYSSAMPPYASMRPPNASHPGAKSPYGPLPGGYPQQIVPSSTSSEMVYPPPSIGYPSQPGMWMQGQMQSTASHTSNGPSSQCRAARRQQQQSMGPQAVYYPPTPSGGLNATAAAHSPGSAHRSRQQIPPNATPSQLLGRNAFPTPSQEYGGAPVYPPGSVEATTSTPAALKRKRTKLYTRDLTMATPKRILMALRSSLTLETIWAINVLNVQLYDDTMPPFSSELMPELLNVVIEHLMSVLSLLFPKEFKVRQCKWALNATESTENTPPNCMASLLTEFCQSNTKELKEGVKAAVRPPIGRQSATKLNFSRISRTGRPVKEEVKEMPDVLKKMAPAGLAVDANPSEQNGLSKPPTGAYTGLAERVRHNLVISAENQWALKKPVFNRKLCGKQRNKRLCLDSGYTNTVDEKEETDENKGETLFYRSAKPSEQWDRFSTPNCSLISRNTSLYEQDEVLAELVNRCLALSNIIRGFSFIPGNEKVLSKHIGLLRLMAKLMRLFADDDHRQPHLLGGKPGGEPTKFVGFEGVKKEEEDGMEVDTKKHLQYSNQPIISDVAAMFLMRNSEQKPVCAPEEDGPERLLLETANHLREDAFVVLAHISVQLDLYDIDSEVSYAIFDALLHWAVSTNLQARDPLLPGIISPRNYALEILCKMSVIERNVDLMLSTGPWPRLEEFVRVLCSLISMGEEIPCREFAIVILNAVCAASEAACYVAAVETTVLTQLVSFLELADSNMHQFVQMQGMQALRENPEMMGTSVGMLRRATLIMVHIARYESCRRYFVNFKIDCFNSLFPTSWTLE
uniref:ARID domain-containing protein n=1 Tax=Ditylenchus dipsaci TaxID=166011 RepID=A0A915DA14_9BILA